MEQNRIPMPYYWVKNHEVEENSKKEQQDREYFRQMYPDQVKKYIKVITEVINRIDNKDSYIYDEYPDKIRMDRLVEITLSLIPVERTINRESQRNLIKVLLWEEVIRRRTIGRM